MASPGQISISGVEGVYSRENRVNWDFRTQIYPSGASLCMTYSLSHTYVETNEFNSNA